MNQTFDRLTLKNPATFHGKGLHSGLTTSVTIAPSDNGLQLKYNSQTIACSAENVTDTRRCTSIGPVSTVEHLMSALAGLGITDAIISVEGNPEMPALDGCSHEFVLGLMDASVVKCGEMDIEGPFARVYEKGDDFSVAIAVGSGSWRYTFDLGARWPGIQDFEFQFNLANYIKEISHARTFALSEEMDWIKENGLGQGLDENSAFVIGPDGYINKTRFMDEPARHKLLDLIGDIYLSGVPPKAINVVATKTGHTANIEMAKKLATHVKITRR